MKLNYCDRDGGELHHRLYGRSDFEDDPPTGRRRECFVISSPHDTYTVARLINPSMPVKHFMTSENLVKFSIDDYTDDIKEVIAKTASQRFPGSE